MSEQGGIGAPVISLADWERDFGSFSMDQLVTTANSLDGVMRFHARQTAIDIWCLGRILKREKEFVGHGNWMNHCRCVHSQWSQDTIERYIKAGQIPTDQLGAYLDKTPSQAYRMLDLTKERPSLPSQANSARVRNFPKDPWASAMAYCPHCDGPIWYTLAGNKLSIQGVRFR